MNHDPLFAVKVIAATPSPQRCIYGAMHQDYSEKFVYEEIDEWPEERKAGEIAVNRLLKGDRGHYGCTEHPQITFATGYFPHSVMQQARTHRIGTSFDCQSMRYTGERISKAANGAVSLEEVFYLRPVGFYGDRNGKKYEYTEARREADLGICLEAAARYSFLVNNGFAEEHARGMLPFDYRQHFVVSFSMRSLMHFLDLRAKLDAQWEIRELCRLMMPHFKTWAPEISGWYLQNRYGKARLSP
jgi:thymidylate synthase (FAD)